MATVSFDAKFQVRDSKTAQKLVHAMEKPQKISVSKRDEVAEKEKGLELLTRLLSASKTA